MTEDVEITITIRMGDRPTRLVNRIAQVTAEPDELDRLLDAIHVRLASEIGDEQ